MRKKVERAALKKPVNAKVTGFEGFRATLEEPLENLGLTSTTEKLIQQETQQDQTLSHLYSTIISGWPSHRNEVPHSLLPFWNFRDELSVSNGIIYKGSVNEYF